MFLLGVQDSRITKYTCTCHITVAGEGIYLQSWPGRGSNPRPSAQKSNTLPRRYKSRLVPQGSTCTSVLYTYTLWHSPPPHWNSSSNFWECENHWQWDSLRFNATCGLFTLGAKCNKWRKLSSLLTRPRIEPATLRTKIQHSTASLLKPACTARQYKCAIYLYSVTSQRKAKQYTL